MIEIGVRMSQALYRKWRPQTWSDVIGQDHVVQTLRNAIQSNRMVHAYLFAGPRGTGKTSTARLLAKTINCLAESVSNRPCNQCEICQAVNQGRFLDLIEIDAASNTSVDDVRDLRDKINFSPSQGKYKVYIIDEVHMLSTAAFNALLKTLEEPPPHAIFVLATTEIHKIPATVLSRCQRHEFRRIAVSDIVSQLEQIAKEENLQMNPAVLTLIARQSTGAMRDAISLLDQLSSTGNEITLEFAHQVLGTATNQAVIQMVDALLDRQSAAGLEHIHAALDSGTDPRQFARQIVEYFRSLLLMQMGSAESIDLPSDIREHMQGHVKRIGQDHLLYCIERFNLTASDIRSNWQPNLPLELAFVECAAYQVPVQAASPPEKHGSPQAPVKAAPPSAQSQTVGLQESSPVKQVKTNFQSAAPAEKRSIASLVPPEADTSATVEPAGETDTLGKVSLKQIRQHWDEIKQLVRNEKPLTEALLNSCVYITVKNSELVLGFASEVVKSKMETKDNMALIIPIISRVLGNEIAIRCIVVDKKTGRSMDKNLDADGMVNAALGLGGQIVQQD